MTCKATTHQYDLITFSRHDSFLKYIYKKKGEGINKKQDKTDLLISDSNEAASKDILVRCTSALTSNAPCGGSDSRLPVL